MLRSDITFDFGNNNTLTVHNNEAEPWRVTVVDTGLGTMTGGRVKRVQRYIGSETFMLTYGDGVSDVNIAELERFHKASGKAATLTAIQPGGKFGVLGISSNNEIRSFTEKHKEDGGWINGGFMVLEPKVFDLIDGDGTTLEREPLEILARNGQLGAYKHDGFWQCMDTLRDKQYLEQLWDSNEAPWMV
jgi:glucose-1-phosphate cytidylyltransferase